ncbi:hypothetical protein [Gillisia sp. JM1]|uniref:hypothetical protein n=1 Tax=Gillisia sp. JM1 TaxID=1283286 RepID=UPI00047E40C3|nr:hypothetical protein [Gillisia sp. JM1]
MRALITSVLALFIFSCAEKQNLTHTETTEIVLESFYAKDNSTLNKYTTSDGYSGLIMIQDMIPDQDKDANVKILDETIDGDLAWVKYTTAYDSKPGVFKLVKDNGQWMVTSKGPRERGPF